ncbi:S-adenosyl-L-methionine-dependent methyltransferase [Macrophomina phaseolina]|uniref:S-adenosyl-L-methionine-dependent methyltransferase n=1 Tax=Macrophomina phaseolina TaxID=35725 RepID=A0ABQ8FTB5_9PEZI|nr:S-adenosyl-L-methionine-dependent methyltransferase [Macrophomina phaseolina]
MPPRPPASLGKCCPSMYATEEPASMRTIPVSHLSTSDSFQSSQDSDSTFGEFPESPSTTTSLASGVTDYRYAHGRRYHAIEDGGYSLPNDDEEIDRLNLQHRVWDIALNGRLYLAPLNVDLVHEALDIGCGTGAWCIDFADAHPDIHVLGTDLSPIQPHNIPANCEFLVDDANADWTFGQRFDYIHTRAVLLGIKDWNKLIGQAFASLRPGGWVEFQEFHIPIGCDDNSAEPDSAVSKWSNGVHEALKNLGIDSMATSNFRQLLESHGFESIGEAHTKFPIGPWPKGEKEKKMGKLFQKDIADNLLGISVKILTNGLGWSTEEVEEFIPKAKNDLLDPHIHTYFPIDIFWARKSG